MELLYVSVLLINKIKLTRAKGKTKALDLVSTANSTSREQDLNLLQICFLLYGSGDPKGSSWRFLVISLHSTWFGWIPYKQIKEDFINGCCNSISVCCYIYSISLEVVTGNFRIIFFGVGDRLVIIGHPYRKDGANISWYVEFYKHVKNVW